MHKPIAYLPITVSVAYLLMVNVVTAAQSEAEDCLVKMQRKDIWQNWEKNVDTLPAKDWVATKESGWGKYVYISSSYYDQNRFCTYIGDFVNGKMTGAGQLLCEDEGLGYTGQFFEGNFHGCGSLGTPAFQYQGQFKHGVFHGYGEEADFISRYRGEFRNGKRHGKGVCVWAADGPSDSCDYQNGRRVK